MKRLAFLLALATPAAFAGVFGVHLGSIHSAGNWCNFNPGIYALTDSGLGAGVLRNSECRTAAWAGQLIETNGSIRLGLFTGAIVGYKSGPQLMVIPTIAVGNQWGARLMYLPKVQAGGAHALHFTVEFRH